MSAALIKKLTISPLRRNAFWLMTAQAVSLIIQLAWAKTVASRLGPEGLGTYSYGLAITQTLGILTDFGLNTFLVREAARGRDCEQWLLSNAMTLKLMSTAVVWAAMGVIMSATGAGQSTVTTVAFFCLAILCQTLAAVYVSLFRGGENMGYEAVSVVAFNLVNLALCLAALSANLPVPAFAAMYAVSSALQLAIMAASYHRRKAWPRLQLDRMFLYTWIRTVFWLGLGGLFYFIYDRGPQIILQYLEDQAAVGIYAAVFRLMAAVLVPPVIIGNALLPRLSSLMAGRQYRQMVGLVTRLQLALACIGLLVTAGLTAFAKPVIGFFYGPGFMAAVPVLRIAAWLALAVFPGALMMNLLIAVGSERKYTVYSGIEMAAGIGGCLWAIPRFGAAGAAAATMAAAVTVNAIITFDVFRSHRRLIADG